MSRNRTKPVDREPRAYVTGCTPLGSGHMSELRQIVPK